MIAGASWTWWLGFHAAVAALLVADAFLPGRQSEARRTPTLAWLWTALLVAVATAFAAWIAIAKGRQPALEFVAGYAIEASLSVDNLFVFLILFQGFRISPRRQHTALLWGVAGAVVLRALFIAGRHHTAASLRMDFLALRPDSALCGLEAAPRRLGKRRNSRMDS